MTVAALREPIYAALFALLSTAEVTWGQATSRRLKMWTDVPPENRPCLFQFEGDDENDVWTNNDVAPKITLGATVIVYINSDDQNPGGPQLNNITDAIAQVMRPSPAASVQRQTLGGLCHSAKIQGKITRVPGDIDGEGMLIIPIEIIVTT